MTREDATETSEPILVKDFTEYLKKIRNGPRLRRLSSKSGISERKLGALRNNPDEPIKYIDASRLCLASEDDMPLDISHFDGWNIPDRDRYETPLGQKVIRSLLKEGESLHDRLLRHSMAHNELNRILSKNVKWSPRVRRRMSETFDRGDIVITDEDYEDQKVNRLKAQWKTAQRKLEEKRRAEEASRYLKGLVRKKSSS